MVRRPRRRAVRNTGPRAGKYELTIQQRLACCDGPAGATTRFAGSALQHFRQVVGQANRECNDRERWVGDPGRWKYRGAGDI